MIGVILMQKRLTSLFKLLNENSNKITCKELSHLLKVSERTIRNDISSINLVLEKNGAIIQNKKGEGYYINILDYSLYQQYLANISDELMDSREIPDSPIERNKYILKYLLYNNSYVKVDDLADMLYVSKVTILNDIKKIKSILSKYNLTLASKPYHGMKIIGKEIDIRRCISANIINRNFDNYIIGITDEEIKLFKNIDLIDLQKFVLKEINNSKAKFLDFNLKNFVIHLAITISRLLENHPLDNMQYLVSTSFKLDKTVDNIFDYIENKYKISLSKSDKIYIYNHFVSKSTPSENDLQNTDNVILEYVSEILEYINTHYNFDLRDDNILYKDLVIHFKSILNSKYYNLNKTNPLINTIKSNYPLAFEISLTAIENVFKKSIYTLTEDEIGYVSLHIGASIERLFQASVKPKNAVIICGSGYGSSRLLEVQLNKIFNNKINIIECLSFNQYNNKALKNIDLIISTIPLTHNKIPVVLVDLTLFKKDIENISKAITHDYNENHMVTNEFFDENLFIVNPNVEDKDGLIKLMCQKLNENEIVFSSFIYSVFYRESLSCTDIDEFLAIPHPMELSSIKTKICVAILKEPIIWNKNSTVRVVFMLAINKDDYINMEFMYDTFLKIIDNDNIKEKISNCTNFSNFISIIKNL